MLCCKRAPTRTPPSKCCGASWKSIRRTPKRGATCRSCWDSAPEQARGEDDMTPVVEAFQTAIRYHQAGDLRHAEQQKRDEAVALLERALAARPDYAEALNNLGKLLRESRRWAEAAVYLQHTLRLRPNYAEAHNNLGLAHTEQGRFAEAEASYQ